MMNFSDKDFAQEVLNYKGVVVVDFYADWCKPCKMLSPIFAKVAANLSQQAKFGKLDIELNSATTTNLSVSSLPTIVIFKDGVKVDKLVGLVSEKNLIEAVQKHLL